VTASRHEGPHSQGGCRGLERGLVTIRTRPRGELELRGEIGGEVTDELGAEWGRIWLRA